MQSSENRVIIACAGSGKTTFLVREALSNPDRRIAIVTYTNNNAGEIIKRFGKENSGVPKHVDVVTWFAFLLRNGARPYQRVLYEKRIESLAFVNKRSAKGIGEAATREYYFCNGDAIYSDKIARFVVECERLSDHQVTKRLRQIYTDVFVDEFQDLAGWDLNLIEMLLGSGIRITLVGDPRQHTYDTNPSNKNKQYLGAEVTKLVNKWEKKRLCVSESMSGTRRCDQTICNFANRLWPGMDPMEPRKDITTVTTEHDGVFLVSEKNVHDYVRHFRPQVLRYDKKSNDYGYGAFNFGMVKGLEFERVLIIPTAPIRKYLKAGDLSHVKSREKLHVAVTRAKHSVGFVFDGQSPVVPTRWPGTEAKETGADSLFPE